MNNSKQSKSVLCFVDGEPNLYDKESKEYIKLELDYDKTLVDLKNELKDVTKRPKMKEIWGILATIIEDCNKFCNNYNKKTNKVVLSNSFEIRITRDISSFLDSRFARMTEQEKQARREAEQQLIKDTAIINDTLGRLRRTSYTRPHKKK